MTGCKEMEGFRVLEMAPFAALAFTITAENAVSGDNYRIFYAPSEVTALLVPNNKGIVELESVHDFGVLTYHHAKRRSSSLIETRLIMEELLKPDCAWYDRPRDLTDLIRAVHEDQKSGE